MAREPDAIKTIGHARRAVHELLAPSWSPGTLAFSGTWYEDDTAFIFTCEPLEWLRDRDPQFQILPGATVIVDKSTGAVERGIFFPRNPLAVRMKAAVRHDEGRYALLDAED